jgi:hypothetical protein
MLKIIIKFLHYGFRIFAGFVLIGILLLQSIWWILKRRGSVMRLCRMNVWMRMMLNSLFSWWILKMRGSVRRRLQRMNMWRRTLLRSLFS